MRILRVAQKVYPDVKGGGPYHVHAMSRDQAEMGHDVTVLTVRTDPSLPPIEKRDGYRIVRHDPTVSFLGNDVSSGLAKQLRHAEGYDVIHAHSHLYSATNIAAIKRRFGDTPLAITNHGLYSQNAPEWVFNLYLRTVGRWTFNQADVVFCYTEADKRRVRSFGVDSRIRVVSNGIDTKRFTPNGPKSDRIDADGPVILFVGRLVDGKRPQDAISAFEMMHENCPSARLYLCGDGPLRGELEALTDDSVRFLGHVSYEEMPEVYRSADVLVLPSRAEGVPRTVLEAMATKVPVVVNDLDHIKSIVERGGISVPTERTDVFANALYRLIEHDDERRRLGERGYEMIGDRFRWQDTAEETTNELMNILEKEQKP